MGALDTKRIHCCHDGRGIIVARRTGDERAFAIARIIERNGPACRTEMLELRPPDVFVRANTVKEDDRRFAAICHAPWTLVEADRVQGKRLASWPSLQTDIRNAGGEWVDEEVVVDGNLITSRNPDDIPAFSNALVDALG